MPLHDWSETSGWEGFLLFWLGELARWLKPRLPAGYRIYAGATPAFAVGAPTRDRPDLGVRTVTGNGHTNANGSGSASASGWEPDQEIAVATLSTDRALFVERQDRLIAAIELISPGNKDRHSTQQGYTSTYAGYLRRGIHLLLVDLHRQPFGFSFAERIDAELGLEPTPMPTPFAISYRVGAASPDHGRFLAFWRRPLTVGAPLPELPLPLSMREEVTVDLEQTYRLAADTAYLE